MGVSEACFVLEKKTKQKRMVIRSLSVQKAIEHVETEDYCYLTSIQGGKQAATSGRVVYLYEGTSRQRSGKGAIRKRFPLQKPRLEKTKLDKQINHDKHPDESKTRTHRLSKLPDDGGLWAPNNLLTPEQKKTTSWTPVGQATDKKLRSQPPKMNSFESGPS